MSKRFLGIGLFLFMAYGQGQSVAGVQPLKPNPSAAGYELIRNGDFNSSGFHWKKTDYYASYQNSQREGVSTFEVVDESAKLAVSKRGSQAWHAQLLQGGLVLEKGRHYTLSARVKVSDKAPSDSPVSLTFALIQPSNQVQVYFEEQTTLTQSNEWTTVAFDFVSPISDDFVRLDINFGRPTSGPAEADRFTLWIDDVSLLKTDDNSSPYRVSEGTGLRAPVDTYGSLSVDAKGHLISKKTGSPVQLRGMSFHGIHWDRPWYFTNREAMLELKEKWNADFVRIPVYLGQGGYIEDQSMIYSITQIIEDAKALKMYAMIDWHVHNDNGNPNRYVQESKIFFRSLAARYGNTPNIIWEIANEPNGDADWSQIKKYADQVIPEIRASSDNPIIVGTPFWSQEVQTVLTAPLAFSNILYTFHFYAATHRLDQFQSKIETALAAGLGLFVTEWGTTTASGYGTPDLVESKRWLDYLNKKGLSWGNWSFSAEQEEAAALGKPIPDINPVPSQRGGWKDSDLTVSGRFVKEQMLLDNKAPPETPTEPETPTDPGTPPNPGQGLIEVLYSNREPSDSTGSIKATLQIKNSSTSALALRDIKLRYYLTRDGAPSLSYAIDYAKMGASNIAGTFSSSKVSEKADTALNLGFTDNAGVLSPGETSGEIQLRIWKSDWSNLFQGNDYSYLKTMTSFGPNPRITGYVSDSLQFGQEP